MLFDVHAHMIKPGMMNAHEFWGPFMTVNGFTVGHFCLGTSQPQSGTDEEATEKLLAKMAHESRRALMKEGNVGCPTSNCVERSGVGILWFPPACNPQNKKLRTTLFEMSLIE